MRYLIVSAALVLACLAGAARGQAPADADTARAHALGLLRGDDPAAALAAARRYNAGHAGDGVMLYNQACLEARTGDRDAAVTTLRRAVAAGFDDPEQMRRDPDLAALAGDPAFTALVTDIASRLTLLATERGARLEPERGAVIDLRPPSGPTPFSSTVRLQLTWRADALAVDVLQGDRWPADAQPHPRLVVTLGLPDADTPYLSRNAFVFAFGADPKGKGWGAVWLPSLGRWQPVTELAPRFDEDGAPVRLAIPWAMIRPLHPLVDPVLGFNATLLVGDAGGPGPYPFAAIPDPNTFSPAAAVRRVVRLDFADDAWTRPAFLGRLRDSIVHGDVLDFALTAVAPAAGQGTLKVDFLDNQGHSLLSDGPRAGALELKKGLQRLPRQASFAGLRTGSYQLRAELGWPGGGTAVWSANVLNLATGWQDSVAARQAAVAPLDRRTTDYYLAAVRDALDHHLPRRDPGPVAKTLGDLDSMLARAAATGSILPADGPAVLVYGGPDGSDRLCSVYRPRPGAQRGPETPVLILDDAPGEEALFAGRFARFYDHGDLAGAGNRHPIYLVPHLPVADRAAEARAALDFVRARFGTDAVPVAGVNGGAGVALQVATDGEGGVGALMILAGSHTDPWPWAQDDFLAERLADLPPHLPIDWTDFSLETAEAGQAPRILALLQGRKPAPVVRTAAGALGLSQAADRLVLWAEELPVPGGGK